MKLRAYQQNAVTAAWTYLSQNTGNPCIVIPTGGGKTPVIATLCQDAVTRWQGRVLVLAHVKELLAQSIEKLNAMAPELQSRIGLYSAGLNRRDTDHPILVAGIQSVYNRANEIGPRDVIIVDEAHLIPPDGEGMYRTLLDELQGISPHRRIIGLTATPYRTGSGRICGPENLLNDICYEISVKQLIEDGFLCKVITKGGKQDVDLSEVRIKCGEFVARELENVMNENSLVATSCEEIIAATQERNGTLIFASGIDHGMSIKEYFQARGLPCGFVCSDLRSDPRDETLQKFRKRELKYLVNVSMLTTGYDAPHIDCVAILRPTMSPGLFYQMVGRGFRICEGKENCLILDFGGNAFRHGPVDAITPNTKAFRVEAPCKKCPECQTIIPAATMACPECGHLFYRAKIEHDLTFNAKPDETPVLSGEITETEYDVQDVEYYAHEKRNAAPGSPRTLCVVYKTGMFSKPVREYICLEHTGFARKKAETWWKRRSTMSPPTNADDASFHAARGALAKPKKIIVKQTSGKSFPDAIIPLEMEPIPEYDETVNTYDEWAYEPEEKEVGFSEFSQFKTETSGEESDETFSECPICQFNTDEDEQIDWNKQPFHPEDIPF